MRKKLIPDEYSKIRLNLQRKIEQCAVVTLIIDIWSSKRMLGFIGFTIQGVTDNFEIFNAFLCVKQMAGRHTGEAIIAEFEDVLRDWAIDIKKVLKFLVVLAYGNLICLSFRHLGCSRCD